MHFASIEIVYQGTTRLACCVLDTISQHAAADEHGEHSAAVLTLLCFFYAAAHVQQPACSRTADLREAVCNLYHTPHALKQPQHDLICCGSAPPVTTLNAQTHAHRE